MSFTYRARDSVEGMRSGESPSISESHMGPGTRHRLSNRTPFGAMMTFSSYTQSSPSPGKRLEPEG